MNVLDLFSGIGGFSLGLERAGMRTVAFCESDEYCRAVLAKHWPGVPIIRDIKHLGPAEVEQLGPIDLVCGGFPCQPFSVAGEQKGKADDRHLWPYMCKVIAYARPSWVVGENVAGLIAMALDDVLADLEGLGYTARTFVIPACAVGAPHRRDRLWMVATNTAAMQRRAIERHESNGDVRGAKDVADADCIARNEGRQSDATEEQGRRDADRSGERSHVGDADEQRELQQSRSVSEEWRRPSDPGWWSAEPNLGRVAHGVPKRVDRLRCLGNAVVPQVVEEIGRAIMRTALKMDGER